MQGNPDMRDLFLRIRVFAQTRFQDEAGQNMVEYALVIAMIGFGTVAGTTAVANGMYSAFVHVGSILSSAM